jgi:hypothetical protein
VQADCGNNFIDVHLMAVAKVIPVVFLSKMQLTLLVDSLQHSGAH